MEAIVTWRCIYAGSIHFWAMIPYYGDRPLDDRDSGLCQGWRNINLMEHCSTVHGNIMTSLLTNNL